MNAGHAGGTPALQGFRDGFVAQPSRLHTLPDSFMNAGYAGGTPALQGSRVGFVAQPSRLRSLDELIGTNPFSQTIEVS